MRKVNSVTVLAVIAALNVGNLWIGYFLHDGFTRLSATLFFAILLLSPIALAAGGLHLVFRKFWLGLLFSLVPLLNLAVFLQIDSDLPLAFSFWRSVLIPLCVLMTRLIGFIIKRRPVAMILGVIASWIPFSLIYSLYYFAKTQEMESAGFQGFWDVFLELFHLLMIWLLLLPLLFAAAVLAAAELIQKRNSQRLEAAPPLNLTSGE